MRPRERPRRGGPFGLVVFVLALLRVESASADEVISDPELEQGKGKGEAPHGDEVISDPELTGKGPEQTAKPAAPAATEPSATTTFTTPSSRPEYPRDAIWRITLGTRWGMDTQWTRPSQDVLEGTTIGVVEAEQRRSEALLLSVGVRARHGFGMRRSGNTRTELDLAPISAFADVTPAPGYHVRAGYQVISMGRFDLFSATNFLAVYDLRSGPVTMPDAATFAQPALRFDFDKLDGFTLQAYYLPFFTPDIVSVYGSNYSLLDRTNDAAVANGTLPPTSESALLPRSSLSTASSSGLRAFAPAPNLTTPQGAVRATVHGTAGELSATIGTALERLPTIGFSHRALTVAPPDLSSETFVHHDRFGVASVDGAIDVGPVQFGAEVAYMMHRTLVATGTAPAPPPPTAASYVDHADLAQGGLRAELVDGSGWAAAVEGMAIAALSVPSDPNFRWQTAGNLRPGSTDQGRYWGGVGGGVHFAPPDTGLRFEVGGAFFNGPSYLVMPRAEWEAVKTVFLEVGAVFVGGPKPTNAAVATTFVGMPNVSLGGLYGDVDQVFTGVRWVP